MDIKNKLIVALDFPTSREALDFVDQMDTEIRFYKVGLELYLNDGKEIISQLKSRKKKIFLDLKFYDIPHTMIKAIRFVANLDIDLFTFHIPIGQKGLNIIYEEIQQCSLISKALGVSILTHFSEAEFQQQFLHTHTLNSVVLSYVKDIFDIGLRGLVCSGEELCFLNQHFSGINEMIKVVPGIRMAHHLVGDQSRVITPYTAITQKADFLVIGRPITQAQDPFKSLQMIYHNMLTGE